MNYFNKLFYFIAIGLLISSCGKNKNLVNSEKVVQNFFEGIKSGNTDLMNKIYPHISTFINYYKSDSVKIKKSKFVNDSLIDVTIENYFTNGFGKKNTNEIDLYLMKDSLKTFSTIEDSKGLSDFKDSEIAKFAINTGCLKKTDTLDVQKNLKLIKAESFAYHLTVEQLLDFMRNVTVTSWSWESGYGDSASGKAIVKNNTTFNIPDVKYQIKYKDSNGNLITSDDGYVSYDKLNAGESKSFTFYTSYVGNASRASILLKFDEEKIKKYILNNGYKGNEYDQFIAEKLANKKIDIN